MSKLFTTEVASVIKESNMYKWATKVNNNILLSSEEKEISEVMDVFAKEIGEKGKDKDGIIAEYIKEVVEPEVFNPDDAILSTMFNIGQIGEFDEKVYSGLPKNTIKVYDAVRGGNVNKSYIDPSIFEPVTFGLQAETEVKYADLRRNGFKSIARLTQMAEESMNNEKYFRIFTAVDNALSALSGDQNINGGSALTIASMDTFATYLHDMATEGNPFMIGLSKYDSQINRMSNFEKYLSDELKNEYNRYGRLGMYGGIQTNSVPTARKTADGKNLIPDKRIFGIAGRLGDMDMKGTLRVYQTEDNDAEKINLKLTGFDVTFVIYYLQKMARIYLA